MSPVPSSPRASARRRVVAPTVVGLLAAAVLTGPPAAGAASTGSKIVYTCEPNLCTLDPASGTSKPLTTDGATTAYRYPSLSADGTRLAALRGSNVVVGAATGNLSEVWSTSRDINDVALSPDGTAVAESHSYTENRFGCPLTGGCLQLVAVNVATWTRGPSTDAGLRRFDGGGGVGFLGTGPFLTATYTLDGGAASPDDTHTVCVVADPTIGDRQPCVSGASQGPGASLGSPAGSPDGSLIAAVRTPDGGAGQVVLFDARSGVVVRELGAGSSPAFSPDGKQVAYQDPAGGISVVPTAGGTRKRLSTAGSSPTWGGGSAPGTGGSPGGTSAAGVAIRSASLRYRGGRIRVTVRCTARTTCRGVARVKKGTTVVGSRSYAVKAGRSAAVSIRPGRAGRRSLSRARRHEVTVRLDPRGAAAITRRLMLRR